MRPAGAASKARARSADTKGSSAALNLSDPKSAQAGERYHIWSAMCRISHGNVGHITVRIRQTSACNYVLS